MQEIFKGTVLQAGPDNGDQTQEVTLQAGSEPSFKALIIHNGGAKLARSGDNFEGSPLSDDHGEIQFIMPKIGADTLSPVF